jgi:UDP-N-acetyl-D-mannosaminuronic acid dehydrogenase
MTLKKIAVIGMGYVGIPAAVLLADAGHDVIGIQRRSKRSGWKIDLLNQGRCPIGGNEPELPEMLKRVVNAQKFKVTDDYSALATVDVILIDVQTPTNDDHIPEYESLKAVSQEIGLRLRPGQLVIIESTVAPGTTLNVVKPILEKESRLSAALPAGFGLAFSYERVMVGRLIHNIREYPKIVGGIDPPSTAAAIDLYATIVRGGVFATDIATAEVAKTVENAYRDVQIAFANEIAILCESFGVDVHEVQSFVNGLPNDPAAPHANPLRNMHFPGAGVGGHCLPKDTWLLMHGYEQYAPFPTPYPFSILTGARRLNDWMPVHMADLLEQALAQAGRPPHDATVAVLGYAFLENSDDARNTPTLPLLRELQKRGIAYRVHDPFIKEDDGLVISQDIASVIKGTDALVLMTAHQTYRKLTPGRLQKLMKTPIIVDGRNIFDPASFANAGFIFKGVGKGKQPKIAGGTSHD